MDKEAFDRLVEHIENAGYDVREYGGRGMMGRTCLGVDCDDAMAMVLDVISGACENASEVSEVAELVEALAGPTMGSMGHGTIVYWKGIPWLGDAPDEGLDDHGIELDTGPYEEVHGKKPGGVGDWRFIPNGDEGQIAYAFNGPYKECLQKAYDAAHAAGVEALMVDT